MYWDQYYTTANLPLLDHGAKLVGRHVHSVKVRQHIATLNLFGHELELTERNLVILEVSKGDLEHTAFQSIGRNLYTRTTHLELFTRSQQMFSVSL